MYKHEIDNIQHCQGIDAVTEYQTVIFSLGRRGWFEEYLIDGELCRNFQSQINVEFFDDEAAEIREQLENWLENNPAPEIEELSSSF